MSLPSYVTKTLAMKPETAKVFDELEDYLWWCRFELLPFDERDLYGKGPHSDQWRKYEKYRSWKRRQEMRAAKAN